MATDDYQPTGLKSEFKNSTKERRGRRHECNCFGDCNAAMTKVTLNNTESERGALTV